LFLELWFEGKVRIKAMGIKDFGQLYKANSSTLTELFSKRGIDGRLKNVIGVDASVLMIRHLKSNNNAQDRLHSEPPLPIDSLGHYCRDFCNPIFKANGIIVMVFDGALSAIKSAEHKRRYGNRTEKQQRLSELYTKKIQGMHLVCDETLAEIRALRKELLTIRPDMIHTVMEVMKTAFGDQVHFIGAPFEADHQLGYLYINGALDYIFTIDSDIMVFGTDVIKAINANCKCSLIKYDNLIEEIPNSLNVNPPIVRLSLPILHHLGCFLGNDYIMRVHGNGKVKAKKFILSLADTDGNINPDEEIVYTAIDEAIKKKLPDEKERKAWMKHWYDAHAMFTNGPVFILSSPENKSLRDAILDDNYLFNVSIGQMCGTTQPWTLNEEATQEGTINAKLQRQYLVGWNPKDDFIENLSRDYILEGISVEKMYEQCASLKRWSKGGVSIMKLPLPKYGGKEMYHGSILDFSKIPINCYSLTDIKFFLASRQVNYSLCKEDEVYEHTNKIWNSVGKTLKPIRPELMRGSGGYVAPELLISSLATGKVSWLHADDLVKVIRQLKLAIDEDCFTDFFGKRNGTRNRILLHLKAGSYDITQISATLDLTCKDHDGKVLVVQGSCAPSQKLKDGNKEKFYSTRIVFDLNDDGSFKAILKTPYTTCNCPNGCIVCSHNGALFFIIYTISKLPLTATFTDMVSILPEPINVALKAPILVEHVWPSIMSDKHKEKRKYIHNRNAQTSKNNEDSNTDSHNGELNGSIYDEIDEYSEEVTREHPIAALGVLDTGITPELKILSKVDSWIKDLEERKTSDGGERQSAENFHRNLEKHVAHKNSIKYQATQLKVLERLDKVLDSRSKVLMRPLLDATRDVREQKKAKLANEHNIDFDVIDLKQCVECAEENVVEMDKHFSDDESEQEESSSNNRTITDSLMFSNEIFENDSCEDSCGSESENNNSQE
jgi:5'-3' exonuclease